ncbi:LysR family transcriptional regulator [Niallia sp. Krafla_26]|uniref:LysR family transcriptional regulator n=1 Tax=Niallia sp. Krafla_26 TaxID=3064703 RepID=UPI003D17126E
MNLKQLHYFSVLARLEHYTKAAAQLSITQPSLSHAISELEKELGTLLFEKHGRNIRLTKYGRFFLQYVDRGLHEIESGEKKLRDLTSPSQGIIELAFIYSLGPHYIPNLIQAFSTQEQFKNVSFTFSQGSTQDIIQGLKEGKYDLAFSLHAENEPEIEFYPLVHQEMVLIVPYDHPLANDDSVDLRDTVQYPYVLFNEKNDFRHIINHLFDHVGIMPQVACEVEEDNAMAGLVTVNYGIAIMPRILSLKHLNVKVLQIQNHVPEQYIYMARMKDRYLCPTTNSFREFAIEYSQQPFLMAL